MDIVILGGLVTSTLLNLFLLPSLYLAFGRVRHRPEEHEPVTHDYSSVSGNGSDGAGVVRPEGAAAH
jgi:hypothetical protein